MGSKGSFFRQTGILFGRTLAAFLKDWKRLLISVAIPAGIALVIVVFCNSDRIGKVFEETRFTIFIIVAAAIYMGMFNSLTLVCKEREIIRRELMTGMNNYAFATSTMILQLIIVSVQALVFTAFYSWHLNLDFVEYPVLFGNTMVAIWLSLMLIMMASSALGLVVSTVALKSEIANLFAPLIIVFQMVLSGVLFTLKGWKKTISYGVTSKWGMDLLGSIMDITSLPKRAATYSDGAVVAAFPQLGELTDNEKAIYASDIVHVLTCVMVLILMIIILTLLCGLLLNLVVKRYNKRD